MGRLTRHTRVSSEYAELTRMVQEAARDAGKSIPSSREISELIATKIKKDKKTYEKFFK